MDSRKKIQKTIQNESIFMSNIGNPEVERQLLKKVLKVSENLSDDLSKELGVKLSREGMDLQNYIADVIAEVRNAKIKGENNN